MVHLLLDAERSYEKTTGYLHASSAPSVVTPERRGAVLDLECRSPPRHQEKRPFRFLEQRAPKLATKPAKLRTNGYANVLYYKNESSYTVYKSTNLNGFRQTIDRKWWGYVELRSGHQTGYGSRGSLIAAAYLGPWTAPYMNIFGKSVFFEKCAEFGHYSQIIIDIIHFVSIFVRTLITVLFILNNKNSGENSKNKGGEGNNSGFTSRKSLRITLGKIPTCR
ncbi:hypothetical protein CLF_101064 [Clonorchis sinensis]|uniref:Uncharacterized protein n=1 Tax=Clonorchis sinensis TaxID=79923 RepID=G7Y4W5_CLOSI|nr:hypothetical protein CLF_101064 [Clonorchis sinensis]